MLKKIIKSRINSRLRKLKGWSMVGESKINRIIVFKNFKDAVRFVNKVARLAETNDHHPDIKINYKKVELLLSTHSVGGLTEKDLRLANQINKILI